MTDLRLDRYDAGVPNPSGRFVLMKDVIAMVEQLCATIEAHNGSGDDPANAVFMSHPKIVWDAVVDRDFAIAAETWYCFAKDNGI